MPSGAKANAGERRDSVRSSLDILNYQDQTVSVSVYSNHQTRSQKAAGAITESIIKVAMIVTSTTVRDLNHQNERMYWGPFQMNNGREVKLRDQNHKRK